ncbi:S-adenosyl-L-methionine-dependent methyltransferase [Usnea florida]
MSSSPPPPPNTNQYPAQPSEVTYDGKTYTIAREGTAEILNLKREADPKSTKNKPQSVFYNPIQQYNRDLSVLAIKAFGEDVAALRKARFERRMGQVGGGKGRGVKRKRGHEASLGKTDGTAQAEGQKWPWEVHEGLKVGGEATSKQVSDGASVKAGAGKEAHTNGAQPSFRILDALSATGLRALRYAREIPMATTVTANDLSSSATASIMLNAQHNNLSDKLNPTTGDAIEHMHRAAARALGGKMHYHVIDLDPYGTAAPFLDAALRALVDGGLLCVTCTDAGVFASLGYLEKTYSQYGGLPLKGPHAHEGGLRLILHAVATSAARYGIAIEPLLSLSIDFYARVFVRIHHSPVEVKFLASKTMIVYSCDAGCGAWSIQHLARPRKKEAKNGDEFYNFSPALAPSANTHCEHCGFKTHQAGPMWGGPLHNPHFIQRILDMLPNLDKAIYGTIPRIQGMLAVALNEALEDNPSSSSADTSTSSEATPRPIPPTHAVTRAHHPFFFLPSALARILHCVSPSDAALRGALIGLGYRTTRSHTKAGSICTDAPWGVIWEVMREWIRQKSPIKEGILKKGTAGWAIMNKNRGGAKLMDTKNELRRALEDDAITDVAGLKKEMEAALYRFTGDARAESQPHKNIEAEGTAAAPSARVVHDGSQDGLTDPSPCRLKIVFDEKLGKEPQGKHMVRYQANPRPDWGPMNRAKGD